METLQVSPMTVQAVLNYLKLGGTRMEGDLLADRLATECNAPTMAAQRAAEIDTAVKAALKDASASKPKLVKSDAAS